MHPNWVVAFSLFAWMLAVAWVRQAVAVILGMRRLTDLTTAEFTLPPAGWPARGNFDLTVVVPACNEEQAIGATLASLTASVGIRLQIIAVDDRSTDRTGVIMDDFVAQQSVVAGGRSGGEHRIEILHNGALPDGWLGKTHALQLAAQRAEAPWLLFTDADVVFAAEALERAMRCAMAIEADHFVLAPSLTFYRTSERAMLASIHALTQWVSRPWKVSDPRARDFMGVGGFNMVRRDVFESLGGFAPLKMEVIEDMSLGWMVKRAGYRSCLATGPGLVKIRWLEGALGIVGNLEKNGFAGFRYKSWLCVLACVAVVVHGVVPLVAMAMGGWALAAGVVTYAALGVIFHANRRVLQIHPLGAVWFAPCALVFCFAFARSMAITLRSGGITWRGTHYPLAELKRNAARWN